MSVRDRAASGVPTERARWVVVGAGSAGCVAAARLSEDPARDVLLVEAGPALTRDDVPAAIDGPDFLAALALPDRTHGGLVARSSAGAAPRPYAQGRGVGGSSVVNAMIAQRGDPAIYEGWGWHDTDAAWKRVRLPEEPAHSAELGPVDRALRAAAGDTAPVALTRRSGRRVTSAEAYLWPAAGRPNLRIRPDCPVVEVLVDGAAARGVRTATGEEIAADAVVLAAGAIHTPAILLRSGIRIPGLGAGLSDHPSATVALDLGEDVAGGLVIGSALRRGGLQVLAMNRTTPGRGRFGALVVALMRPRSSSGSVSIIDSDSGAPPVVELDLLRDPRDVDELRRGVELVRELLSAPSFRAIAMDAYVDDHGTRLDALVEGDAIERWLRTTSGNFTHPVGTCALGTVLDDDGWLVGYTGIAVCDAAAFPGVPDVSTHLPTTMLAERLVARWAAGREGVQG